MVKDGIAPLIPADVLGDQFGFKPAGSTTAALIDLTHKERRSSFHGG